MDNDTLRSRILGILRKNARIPTTAIADRLGTDLADVETALRAMEKDGTIMGYSPVINEERAGVTHVRAIIEVEVQPERDGGFDRVADNISKFPEVESVCLVSGRYDLRLEVVGDSLQDIASFVASKLASQEGVKATTTHFLLKKYKEAGVRLHEDELYERLKVVP